MIDYVDVVILADCLQSSKVELEQCYW